MKIVYHDGPSEYETQGHGVIRRGVPREMDDAYAQGLIDQGIVQLAEPTSVETED